MVNAGDFRNVIDVVDEHRERCLGNGIEEPLTQRGDAGADLLVRRAGVAQTAVLGAQARFDAGEALDVHRVDELTEKIHVHDTTRLRDGAQHVVGEVAAMQAQCTRAGMRCDDRPGAGGHRVPERRVRHMRDVDEHTDAIHLADDRLALRREACGARVVLSRGGTRPRVAVVPGQCHVAHTRRVQLAQLRDGSLDGVTTFHADEDGNLALPLGAAQVGTAGREEELVGMTLHEGMHLAREQHRARKRTVRRHERIRRIDEGREELPRDAALQQARIVRGAESRAKADRVAHVGIVLLVGHLGRHVVVRIHHDSLAPEPHRMRRHVGQRIQLRGHRTRCWRRPTLRAGALGVQRASGKCECEGDARRVGECHGEYGVTANSRGVAETNGLPATRKRSGQSAARVMPMRGETRTCASGTPSV